MWEEGETNPKQCSWDTDSVHLPAKDYLIPVFLDARNIISPAAIYSQLIKNCVSSCGKKTIKAKPSLRWSMRSAGQSSLPSHSPLCPRAGEGSGISLRRESSWALAVPTGTSGEVSDPLRRSAGDASLLEAHLFTTGRKAAREYQVTKCIAKMLCFPVPPCGSVHSVSVILGTNWVQTHFLTR